MHDRQVGEGELREDDGTHREQDRRRPECATPRERRRVQIAHIEEIEDLEHDDRVDDHGAGGLHTEAAAESVEEDGERARHEDQ